MEIIYITVAFLQSLGVSLGVGASTIAVLNFLAALRDGEIDQSERTLMGVVYTVLRVAMGVILVTMFVQGILLVSAYGNTYFTPFVIFAWMVVFVLYANAILMTAHLIPRSIGPALQAGSWYMLAILYFLTTIDMIDLSFAPLAATYAAVIVLALIAINGLMAYVKVRLKKQ